MFDEIGWTKAIESANGRTVTITAHLDKNTMKIDYTIEIVDVVTFIFLFAQVDKPIGQDHLKLIGDELEKHACLDLFWDIVDALIEFHALHPRFIQEFEQNE